MDKNLSWKIGLIVLLTVLAGWTLYPPDKTLKQGMDLGGGTSLVYEIDAQDLSSDKRRGLAGKMITTLRRRVDPANIQNLIWRPQGNTRFEIQMPLANAETREKRQAYEQAHDTLLAENVDRDKILRSLASPADERIKEFAEFARDSNDRLQILQDFAGVYDERKELRSQSNELSERLKQAATAVEDANLNIGLVKLQAPQWSNLTDEQLREQAAEVLGTEENLDLVAEYVGLYGQWAQVVDKLTDPAEGLNVRYDEAQLALDRLNISGDQIDYILGMAEPGSARRQAAIEQLKTEFPNRADKIDRLLAAYDDYYPFRGRLDDPKDLQRMLKGAGILEFRILPTVGHEQVSTDRLEMYVETLKSKGPKYASDEQYVWCEVENAEQWRAQDEQGRSSVVAPFGDKWYVLASNKKDEAVLHNAQEQDWTLERAAPGQDQQGRRSIDFALDERGGRLFAKVTGDNVGRPLCILLDGVAISAPNIKSRIYTRGQITGSFTQTEVQDMVSKLEAGTLPAMLIEQPISVKTVGPSMGADNRDKGIRAGLIGLAAVVACMLVYYTLAGSIADVALFLNILFVLGIMAGLRATFTLPGIAGIILTIGMSVDANVLIFERIREEQGRGSSLRIAIRNGYQRAFSTILDANITTLITAVILLWVASEEIKGFAIVLILGILSSMFTALFVTRVVFAFLVSRRIIKDHLVMLSIIRHANVNWMKLRPVFLTISGLLMAAGLVVFFTRDNAKNNKYDIEFTGGTSVQIDLREPTTREHVEAQFKEVASQLGNPALAAANIYSVGKSNRQFGITTTETNRLTAEITFEEAGNHTVESVRAAIRQAEEKVGGTLSNLVARQNGSGRFVVTTSQPNQSVVRDVLEAAFADAEISQPQFEEVVNNAILEAFGDDLVAERNLEPTITAKEKISEQVIESHPELAEFTGGIKISCELALAATPEEIHRRLTELRSKPDMREMDWYSYRLLNSDLSVMEPNEPVNSFVYVSVLPEAGFRQISDEEWERFEENETRRVTAAAQLERSMVVTQINPSVGAEAKTRALIAIVLSLFAIVGYIWVRFGDVRYGIAAIVALIHDVCITLGAVTACTYIAYTAVGQTLLVGDFKINLAIIAAFLTLIGYSLNDTIVVFDRIRENRKKAQLTPQTISSSINQTLSRTILTSFTTFIVVLIMYIFGGDGLRGFTFAIGFGVLIGTYSSIAIASPILLLGTAKAQAKAKQKNGKGRV